jgi:hypothetical protein
MFCRKCGREQLGNPKFCRSCGAKLSQVSDNQFAEVAGTKSEIVVQDELFEEVRKKFNEGKGKDKIVKDLVKKGWAKEAVIERVDSVEQAIEEYKRSPEGRRELASKYKRMMIFGLLWVVGGIVATVATYEAASEGGVYFIFWGAVIFGAIDFFRGLAGWLKYNN